MIQSASDEVHTIIYGYLKANGFSLKSKKKKNPTICTSKELASNLLTF